LALGSVVATGFVARLPAALGSRARRMLVSPVSARTAPTDIAVLVHLFDIRPGRVISRDVLCALYGLTCAEANVAVNLFAGLSVDQTADALELSVNTVRTHLKHIFTKCDVHSQGELLHLLDQGPRSL
jgi:DNA-binding CsgD family transcriptional regulator